MTYTLNTITYVVSAPFLAIRALQQLAFDFEDTYLCAVAIIRNNFYVDDLITGSPDNHRCENFLKPSLGHPEISRI